MTADVNDEFHYHPDMRVVRSARSFIQSLCEVYGAKQGMAIWDTIRSNLGEDIASDIFLGMLIGSADVTLFSVPLDMKINAIKEVRAFTGFGLKEAKDFVEEVTNNHKHMTVDTSGKTIDDIDRFCKNMRMFGCDVR